MVANRWPEKMDVLKEGDFVHGSWMEIEGSLSVSDKDGFNVCLEELTPKEIEKAGVNMCGTQCCLVGHVRNQWGLPADPSCGDPLPPVGQKFLKKFCELAGAKIYDDYDRSVEYQASDVFEAGPPGEGQLEPKEAARLWKKTLRFFGYDA